MPQLPDVSCLVKVINSAGKRVKAGELIWGDTGTVTATVRYVAFNDSVLTAGPFTIIGHLSRDGVPVKPNGKPVVPVQTITLQPGQIWTAEFEVIEKDLTGSRLRPPGFPHQVPAAPFTVKYKAHMFADWGLKTVIDEEDEANNAAQTTFRLGIPKTDFPDVSCLIKVIDAWGKRVRDGDGIYGFDISHTVTATVRYVVFNLNLRRRCCTL
jgi:hypothetical protein